MTVFDLDTTRRRIRAGGAIDAPLLAELRAATVAVTRRLPPSLSPYGTWDDEAVDEVLSGWLEGKLLRGDQLFVLLDRARSVAALRRMAERSVYHWLLANRERTHAANLFDRLAEILAACTDMFVIVRENRRRRDVAYTLVADRHDDVFSGPDRILHAAAWAQGELALFRYTGGNRLSPLVHKDQLKEFAAGVMRTLGSAVTVGQLMVALGARVALRGPSIVGGDVALEIADESAVAERVLLMDAARATISLLSDRQAEILVGTYNAERGNELAARLGCSNATVHYEQKRIAKTVDLFAENNAERAAIIAIIIEELTKNA